MWKNKIKHNKVHYAIMSVLLIVVSMIISTAFGYLMESNAFATLKLVTEQDYDLIYMADDGFEDRMLADDEINDDIISIGSNPMLQGVVVKEDDVVVAGNATIFFTANYKDMSFIVETGSENTPLAPLAGEIWMPLAATDKLGISVGDNISISNKKFTITDTFSCVLAMSTVELMPSPFIMNTEDALSLYADNPSYAKNSLFTIKCVDGTADDILRTVGMSSTHTFGGALRIEDIAQMETMTPMITGLFIMIAGFTMLAIAIVVITTSVKHFISKQLGQIGTYKSMGFSNQKIKNIYLNGYMLIGAISTIIGGFLALPIVHSTTSNAAKYIGNFSLTYLSSVFALLTIVIVLAVFYLIIVISLRSITKITPNVALSMGYSSGVRTYKKSVIKNARSSASLAVNDIFKHKAESVRIFILLLVVFLMVFCMVGMRTYLGQVENVLDDVGFPVADTYVTSHMDSETFEQIKAEDNVESISVYGLFNANYSINNKISPLGAIIVSNDFEVGKSKYKNGRGPKNSSEIAITSVLADNLNVGIGTYLDISIKGLITSRQIVGIMEYSMFVTADSMHIHMELDELFNQQDFFVNLAINIDDNITIEDFKARLEADYDNVALFDTVISTASINIIVGIVEPVIDLMVIMFILAGVLIVLSMLIMQHVDNIKNYAIAKSLGIKTTQIVTRNMIKILILMVLALVLSLIIALPLTPVLFGVLFGVTVYGVPYLAIGILTLLLFTMVTAVVCSFGIAINKIEPSSCNIQ